MTDGYNYKVKCSIVLLEVIPYGQARKFCLELSRKDSQEDKEDSLEDYIGPQLLSRLQQRNYFEFLYIYIRAFRKIQ